MASRCRRFASVAMMVVALFATAAAAQELDPRALVISPVGMDFLVVAAGYAGFGKAAAAVEILP